MYVARIELLNYGPFQGHHTVELGPGAYAVVARHEAAPDRSNWSGKTWLLNAVRHALYGEHMADDEDGWITRGEQEGCVALEVHCDDHMRRVERRRIRGRSTQLTTFDHHGCVAKDGENRAKGKEAEDLITRTVGLERTDFDASCYFRQKQMSRFVTSEPGERMRIVSWWLRLERLQACADNSRARLAAGADSARVARERLATVERELTELGANPAPGTESAPGGDLEALRGRVARLEDQRDKLAEWRRRAEIGARYATTVEEGRRLKAGDLPEPGRAQELERSAKRELEDAAGESRRAKDALRDRAEWVGGFEATCPVAGFKCPAAAEVRIALKADTDALDRDRSKSTIAAQRLTAKRSLHEEAQKLVAECEARDAELARLRVQANEEREHARWAAANRPDADGPELDAELAQARQELAQAQAAGEYAKRTAERVARLEAEAKVLKDGLARQERACDVLREASQVFQGARRRVAESVLGGIEAEANGRLADAGVELGMAVRWAREAKDLADACDACGHAYPASQRVKACARCGAARGPKLVQRLEVVPTDRSGAADDLAGVAFQLAAAMWLRRDRGAAWSSCVLDEPLSALDAAHRQGMMQLLLSLVGEGRGFSQLFLVSHTSDVGLFPKRIEVAVLPTGARAITVHGG